MQTASPIMRRRARRLAAGLRREQILDAAITAFSQAPYKEVSTASIAATLGISEPALFRHYPTKQALYLAAIDRSAELLLNPWREIVDRSSSALAALVEISQHYYAELQADSRHMRLRFRSSTETSDPEVASHVREHFLEVFELLHNVYESARSAGEIDPNTDTRAHAWLLVAIGTLLDTTQIIGLRQVLPLASLPAILLRAMPKLASPSNSAASPAGPNSL